MTSPAIEQASKSTRTEAQVRAERAAKKSKRWQDGMYRIVRDGVPCYVAPWVRDLTPAGRALLQRGSKNPPAPNAVVQAQRHPQTTYVEVEPAQ